MNIKTVYNSWAKQYDIVENKPWDLDIKSTIETLSKNGLFFISELHPFKQYLGSKAKYETENGLVEPEVYIHNISDYLCNAEKYRFKLIELKERFDKNEKKEIPRIISFLFRILPLYK